MPELWKWPVSAPLFVDALAQEIVAEARAAGRKPKAFDTRLRFSDAGKCARAIAYGALGLVGDELDPSALHVAWIGTKYHEYEQAAILRRFPFALIEPRGLLPALTDSGHADAVIPGWKECAANDPESVGTILVQSGPGTQHGLLVVDGIDRAWVRTHGGWWSQGGELASAPAGVRALERSHSRGSSSGPSVSSAAVRESVAPGGSDSEGEHGASPKLQQGKDALSAGPSLHTAEYDSGGDGQINAPSLSDLSLCAGRSVVVRPARILVEIKTKSSFQFDAAVGYMRKAWKATEPKGPGYEVILQAGLNAIAHDCTTLAICYVTFENISIGAAEKLGLRNLDRFCAEWIIPKDVWLPMVDREMDRMHFILESLDGGELPERMVYNTSEDHELIVIAPEASKPPWNCQYCSYRSQCESDGPGVVPIPVEIRGAT